MTAGEPYRRVFSERTSSGRSRENAPSLLKTPVIMRYRETTVDLHSNVSKEDVIAAENVLLEYRFERKKAQEILQKICHVLLDLEIYDEESDEHSTINYPPHET